MNTVSINIPEITFIALGENSNDLGREILIAAVVKWFELGKISQGKAAEILEISRAEFLDVLSDYQVSAWQYIKEDLDEELNFE